MLTTFAQKRRGLVVKAKTHDQKVLGSNPHYVDHFLRHRAFGSKLGTRIVENSNLALLHVL
jgi:hypothetical protein